MHIHIHAVETGFQMEDAAGEFTHHLLVLIGLLQGGGKKPGANLPAVNKKVLGGPGPPAADGLGDKARNLQALSGAVHRDKSQGQVPAQYAVQGGLELAVSGGKQFLFSLPDEFQGHLRVG